MNDRTITKWVRELSPAQVLLGRPLRLGPGLGVVLALSLGSESLRCALVDANGKLWHADQDQPHADQLLAPPAVSLARMRRLAASVLQRAFDEGDLLVDGKLRMVGLTAAWPTPVDRDRRVRGTALADDGWRARDGNGAAAPLDERLGRAFGPPFDVPGRTHAMNDVNAQALAIAFRRTRERAGQPDDRQSRIALVVRVGGGIGAATIEIAPHTTGRLSFLDSRLIVGTNGLGGELGHLPVARSTLQEINAHNPKRLARLRLRTRCSCGADGHLEAFASGTAVARRLEASRYEVPEGVDETTSLLQSAIAEPADARVVQALVDSGRLLGTALTGPILMLDPHSLTLTGSLATSHLIDGLQRRRDVWSHAIGSEIVLDHLDAEEGSFAGVRGAALAVLRAKVYRRFEQPSGDLARSQTLFDLDAGDVMRLAAG